MRQVPETENILRPGDLPPGRTVEIKLTPDAKARAAIATALGIQAVRKLRLHGQLIPLGRADWRLEATLGATVVQDCVVTLAPVTTRIDEPIQRSYLAKPPHLPAGEEIEMPEDDSVEPLPAELDLTAIMTEALALALPVYPHAEGLAPLRESYTAPGIAPLGDDEAKPFAGLAGLRDTLGKKDD